MYPIFIYSFVLSPGGTKADTSLDLGPTWLAPNGKGEAARHVHCLIIYEYKISYGRAPRCDRRCPIYECC